MSFAFLVLSRIVSTFQIKTISKVIIIFLQYFGLLASRISSRMVIIQDSNHPFKHIPNVLYAIENILKAILTRNTHCCIAWPICSYVRFVTQWNSNEVYFSPRLPVCTNIPYRIIHLLQYTSTVDKCFHDPYLHVYATFLTYHTNVEAENRTYQAKEHYFKKKQNMM